MLRRYLLDGIDLPTDRFHFLDTEAKDLAKVCRDYDVLIEGRGGFDLTLLGIGLNGHLGLNEPGSSHESTTRRVAMHESTIKSSAGYLTHSNLPTWGVGVGLKHLLGSKVESVRTSLAHGKVKRQGKYVGRRSDWKKAYVKLREGEKLPEFLQGA